MPSQRAGIQAEDLDAALANYGELLDIDRGDLEEILTRAATLAQRRQMGQLRCQDIMSRDVMTTHPDSSVQEVWDKLAHHRIKSLPVTDADGRLRGIISVPDFFIDRHNPQRQRQPRMLDVATVQDIMTKEVFSIRADSLLSDLIMVFSDGGLHHMPVVDDGDRLVWWAR